MNNIKTLIWNYIICKYWRDYIQEEKDDIVAAGKFDKAATDLSPSQKQIVLVKAVNMALNTTDVGGKFPAGGDIDAIISKDLYIN